MSCRWRAIRFRGRRSPTFYIYRKGSGIYYFSIRQLQRDQVFNEAIRRIGDGDISSIRWGSGSALYYISGLVIYSVDPNELFARNFYIDILGVGRVIGRLPFEFDPSFDKFWISPNQDKVLINKGSRSLFLYVLNHQQTNVLESVQLPHLFLPRDATIRTVLWSADDIITILISEFNGSRIAGTLYRMVATERSLEFSFDATQERDVRGVVLSPNGLMAAVILPDRVIVKQYSTWRALLDIRHVDPLHAIWKRDSQLVIAGGQVIEEVDMEAVRDRQLIGLSQTNDYGFGRQSAQQYSGYEVQAEVGTGRYRYARGSWQGRTGAQEQRLEQTAANDAFRVFVEQQSTGSYRTVVLVRDLRELGTRQLFQPSLQRYEPFPFTDEVGAVRLFHPRQPGSASGRLALVFNAVDSAEGLTTILNTLQDYNIRATFFLNGEFIKTNPEATVAIAEAGHETGSLFFHYFDMTDSVYQVDREFIRRGLALNENLFFATTGRELSLLWHAPYYFVNPAIIAASNDTNYRYIGRDVDTADWIPRLANRLLVDAYLSSWDIIERLVETKRPGSIIPIRIGVPADDEPFGGRNDYLFNHLDLLINRLTERGYSIVPVSALIEGAR